MFSSSTLMENTSGTSLSINNLSSKSDDSYLYSLLEFNADLHEIDIDYKCSYYKALKELSETTDIRKIRTLEEGVLDNFSKKIVKVIQAIIDFIKKVVQYITNKDVKIRNEFRKLEMRTHFITYREADSAVFTIYNYPSIVDIDDQKCRASLNNIISEIDSICDGHDLPATSDAGLAMAYKALARIVKNGRGRREYNRPVDTAESFKEYVKTDIVYTEKKEMTYETWRNTFKDLIPSKRNVISKKLEGIRSDLEKCQSAVQNSTKIVDEEQRKNVDALVAQIRSIVSSYTWFITYLYETETKHLEYIVRTYNRFAESKNEAGFIHGEPFNSDTLFDNEDLRGFNPTEWLDLSLTTECYEIKSEMLETHRSIAVQEAIILSDDNNNKFRRLIAMREAEGNKLGTAIKGIIERIKSFIDQFFSKLKDKYGKNSAFIKRNTENINKPIQIKDMTSSGDILAGMYRIQSGVSLTPFNYQNMKDELSDKKKFFAKYILPSLKSDSQYSKRDLKWSDDMSITDYCKAYYGASMPEDKYSPCKFTGKEIEANKQNIVKFLNQSNTFLASIRTDIGKLESEAKKVSANTSNPQQQSQQNDDKKDDQPKEEAKNESMYYSELYKTWFTEADINMDNTSNNSENGGDDNKDGEDGLSESSAFKNYVDCYKDVLLSKLTASEFIVNELMQVIRKHAESYMSEEQKKKEAETSEKEKNAAPASNK